MGIDWEERLEKLIQLKTDTLTPGTEDFWKVTLLIGEIKAATLPANDLGHANRLIGPPKTDILARLNRQSCRILGIDENMD